MNRLKDCYIAIVKHTLTSSGGVEQELLKYLKGKAKKIVYISHPFPEAYKDVPLNTKIDVYNENGDLVKGICAPLIKGPNIFFYFKDVLYTLYYIWRQKTKFQLYVGVDNLNAFSGLILRKLKLVEKTIFYVIDYVPQRFENRLLNKIYHWIDKMCCYHSDYVWNVSAAMVTAREQAGICPAKMSPQITVPLGCDFEDIQRLSFEDIDRYTIVYMGNLKEEQGVQLAIEALPAILNKESRTKLVIIGSGNLQEKLKSRAKELGVDAHIDFKGFIKDDKEVERILAGCAIGVAPYPDIKSGYKQFCDPGKIKIYMACGLPVVITKVPRIAWEIEKHQAGIAIEYDKQKLADAVIELLLDEEKYKLLRRNAIEFASEFDWMNIFTKALDSCIEHLD